MRMNHDRAPRVFFHGDIVPAGTAVLDCTGNVEYLDDTGSCYCADRDPNQPCKECTYDVRNGDHDPLVEVILPDYATTVADAQTHRAPSTRN